MTRLRSSAPLAALTLLRAVGAVSYTAGDDRPRWEQTGVLPADEAFQAAADEEFVYGIARTSIAKYDRLTGARVAVSRGNVEVELFPYQLIPPQAAKSTSASRTGRTS